MKCVKSGCIHVHFSVSFHIFTLVRYMKYWYTESLTAVSDTSHMPSVIKCIWTTVTG